MVFGVLADADAIVTDRQTGAGVIRAVAQIAVVGKHRAGERFNPVGSDARSLSAKPLMRTKLVNAQLKWAVKSICREVQAAARGVTGAWKNVTCQGSGELSSGDQAGSTGASQSSFIVASCRRISRRS